MIVCMNTSTLLDFDRGVIGKMLHLETKYICKNSLQYNEVIKKTIQLNTHKVLKIKVLGKSSFFVIKLYDRYLIDIIRSIRRDVDKGDGKKVEKILSENGLICAEFTITNNDEYGNIVLSCYDLAYPKVEAVC